ncbi:hypothetical protein [Maribacter sp. 2308TA10-17]|uniref:hypothetical protein n=1 Tax=Maribacter sp. 2308TA10-17 TaxID=3386276 RepID=UPI0039BD8675
MKPSWKRIIVLLVIIGVMLLIPLVAMQFTEEVNWGLGDFVITAFLLFATALLIELFSRKIPNSTYRRLLIALVLLCLVLL